MDTKERLLNKLLSGLNAIRMLFSGCWDTFLIAGLVFSLLCGGVWYARRWMPPEERTVRQQVVHTAEYWLGVNEADGSHQEVIDLYNSHEPSPRDYQVTYEDNWCAAFGSTVAMQAGLDRLIPVECSCEQQILLFEELGCWQEDECYLPQPGDYIYYVWDEWRKGDCTAWANHVGIVVETCGPVIKVIEGNKDDQVAYRYIFLNDITIRGFGLPDYTSKNK